LTRSRHHLYSNSLREKRISVEPTVRAYSAGKTTIEEKAAEHPRSPTWKPPVNGQNCHHETKHWEETMKTLRVKQNRVQTTVRRRQYDDRRENCTACIHHRFSVTCTTAILILRFVSNYATGNFSLWFGWKQQNIFTRLFKPTVNCQKNFWVGIFVRFHQRRRPKNEICYARGLLPPFRNTVDFFGRSSRSTKLGRPIGKLNFEFQPIRSKISKFQLTPEICISK